MLTSRPGRMAALAALAVATGSAQAAAQSSTRTTAHGDAMGREWAGVQIYPQLETGVRYVSNVFAQSDSETSDQVYVFRPSIDGIFDGERLSATLNADVSVSRFADNTSQNRSEWTVGAQANTVGGGNTSYAVSGSFSERTANRGTFENDLTSGEPLTYRRVAASVAQTFRSSRLRGSTGITFSATDYDDIDIVDGRIDQAFRNNRRVAANGRLGLNVSPVTGFYADAQLARSTFPDASEATDRDATNGTLRVGGYYEITELIDAEASIGIRRYDFDNDDYADIEGASYAASLVARPTRMTTLTGALTQTVTTSVFETATAVDVDRLSFAVRHELLRYLHVDARAEVSRADYRGTGTEAEIRGLALGADYDFLDQVGFRFRLDYRARDVMSDDSAVSGYQRLEASGRLILRL